MKPLMQEIQGEWISGIYRDMISRSLKYAAGCRSPHTGQRVQLVSAKQTMVGKDRTRLSAGAPWTVKGAP